MEIREILFRGKSLSSRKWVQGYLFKIWEKAYICWGTVNDVPDMTEVDPATVCQYTGLTDKNGRKIFEGDVVETPSEDERYVIKWDTDTARFAIVQHGSIMCDFDNYWGYELEVIGDIFDNPELTGGAEEHE